MYEFGRKNIAISTLLMVALLTGFLGAAKIKTTSKALNVICKMRIDSQKALKTYMLVGLGSSFGNPKEELAKVIVSFDDAIEPLQVFLKGKDGEKGMTSSTKIWKASKATLQADSTKEGAKKLQESLQEFSENLGKLSETLRPRAIKETGNKRIDTYCMVARQSMLAQRIAAIYLMRIWKIDNAIFEKKLSKVIKKFKISHKKLKAIPFNTDKINTLLKKADKNIFYFEMLNKTGKKRFVSALISEKANTLSESMTEMLGLYTKL